MRVQQSILYLLGLVTFANALALPESLESWTKATPDLFKRKGGGGGGGRGGGSSSSSSGSSSGSSGSRGSGSSSGSSGGTGSPRGYGGGAYYGGGASQPYRAGATRGSVAPYIIGGAALGFLPGLWLYSVYAYSWPGYYTWHNNTNNQDENGPVNCLCQQYSQCGCEQNNDTDYLTNVANDQSVAYRAANGTLYINGTLSDDTTAPTTTGAATKLRSGLLENSGYWFVFAGVIYAVSML